MDRFVSTDDDIVIEELDGGLVIYDGREARAHWLDESATAAWRACREPRTESEIAEVAALDGATCALVLSQLIDIGLVRAESGSGYSRRAVLRTAAKVGLAGAVSAPIISAVVPAAAAAASALPPQPPSPPQPPVPGVITQTAAGDHDFVPGPPSVSDVTVTVIGGNGVGGNKPSSKGFSLSHATVNRHGAILLALSTRSAGALTAVASFTAVELRPGNKRRRLSGSYGSGSTKVGGRGSVNLGIAPTKAAQRALAAGALLTVTVRITFTPAGGGIARTITATLSFSERRQNRP